MTLALTFNCHAQRRNFSAISNRFAAGQSAAISSSSGSSVTGQNFCLSFFMESLTLAGWDNGRPTLA